MEKKILFTMSAQYMGYNKVARYTLHNSFWYSATDFFVLFFFVLF